MQYFLSICTTGLIMGLIYALMALGLTLIFSILHVVNFAHGEFYMLGGYASIVILGLLTDLHPLLAVPLAGGGGALIGLIIETGFLRPMHQGKIERPAEYAVLVLWAFLFPGQPGPGGFWPAPPPSSLLLQG